MPYEILTDRRPHFAEIYTPCEEMVEEGEFCISLEEQLYNVRNGACLLELRDALQGIPGLVYPNTQSLLNILSAAEYADIPECTVSIQTGDGLVIDQTTRDLLLHMRDLGGEQAQSLIIPSFAIPSTAKGAEIAEDLIVNYHRGLQIKVFISAAEERMRVHGWTLDGITSQARDTVTYLTSRYPNKVVTVIEQASQASDDNLFHMIDMSAEAHASGVCLADTLSFFGEEEAFAFVFKVRKYIHDKARMLDEAGNNELANQYRQLRIEYHGHNDFGKASEAAVGAMRAGAVVHVTPGSPAGIGERAGNASVKGTYEHANRFLTEHGDWPVKPVDAVALLDMAFINATNVDPAHYGPEGDNANTTCAALHADYILKIYKKLEQARADLKAAFNEAPESLQVQELQGQVAEYSRLMKEGYLPRRGDQAVGEHHFRLSAYSNEDTVRMYYHELTGKSPMDIPQEKINYILWVIKNRNRPLTPLELRELFGVDEYPYGAYPWSHSIDQNTHYQPDYIVPKTQREIPSEPVEPVKWQRYRV